MRSSSYDKTPFVEVCGMEGECCVGWPEIVERLRGSISSGKERTILVVECYPGVREDEILRELSQGLKPSMLIRSAEAMLLPAQVEDLVRHDLTEDPVFGRITSLRMEDFFNPEKLREQQQNIATAKEGLILVVGTGASLLAGSDVLVYADLPRWEAQLRFRRNESSNLGVHNATTLCAAQYKRAFFVDWRVADRLKRGLMTHGDFVLDTTWPGQPKLATGKAIREGLRQAVRRPFRVVPFFDPAPWGGQWMKEVCDLDPKAANFGWCFDCVPEENSLLLGFGAQRFEIPAINLIFDQPEALLGEAVYKCFGAEFPIRFDFLDTMGGGNLSLQVHPLKEYIREHFGMTYTQDESYYMLDTAPGAEVYLGLKEGIQRGEMLAALEAAQKGGSSFDADRFAQKWPAKKHDHFLIPAGTVHCSGKGAMVLEISATPYIFTFKLWDWGRMGLDGRPRPVHLDHGSQVIQWDRTTAWTARNLVNRIELLGQGEGWREERTGLHELEFIETRRHWFTDTVPHDTAGGVNVLNLVEGGEAVVESPSGAFDPFVVHYAETFIVPAAVGAYTIRPHGSAVGRKCATLKAHVRS